MRYTFLVSLCLFVITAWGQPENLFRNTVDTTFTLTNSTALNTESAKITTLLGLIPGSNSSIEYSYKIHQEVNRVNQSIEVILSVGNLFITKDYFYKNFDINQLLYPDKISYSSELLNNGQSHEKYGENNTSFKNGKNLVKKMLQGIEGSNLSLVTTNIKLGYDAKSLKKLEDYFKTVDKYYDADAQITLIEKELAAMPIDSIELLKTNLEKIKKYEESFKDIKSERFASKLSLAANDPVKLVSHLGMAQETNRIAKEKLEKAIAKMYITHYEKGLNYLQNKDIANAKAHFIHAVNYKNDYAPARYRLASINFSQNTEYAILPELRTIVNQFKPDNDTRYLCYQLAESTINNKTNQASDYIKKLQPHSAKPLIDTCDLYARTIDGIRKFPELDEVKKAYYQTLFEFLVHEGTLALEKEQLNSALAFADSSVTYANSIKDISIDRTKVNSLAQALYNRYLETSDILVNKSQLKPAWECCTKAKYICTSYDAVSCSEELTKASQAIFKARYSQMLDSAAWYIEMEKGKPAVEMLKNASDFRAQQGITSNSRESSLFTQAYQLRYIELIGEGNQQVIDNRFSEAIIRYEEARQIEKTYPVEKDAALSNKLYAAAKGSILQLCTEGEIFAENMLLDKARSNYSKANTLKSSYLPNIENEVDNALQHFSEIINQGNCNQALYEYNIQITAAKKFINNKEFVYANDAFKKALSIAEKQRPCVIPDSVASHQLQQIKSIYKYQTGLIEIENLIDNKEFEQTLEDYKQLELLFADSSTNDFGVTCKPLFEFISSHKNGQLADYAIGYYISLGEHTRAIQLLENLYQREYIKSWSKESQIKLGKYLAQADFEANSQANAKIKVLNYLKDPKWYSYLKRAYLKEWKILKKNTPPPAVAVEAETE